jgi:tetratricopeptide (TPR) repeat protein
MRLVVTIILFLIFEPLLLAQNEHKYIRQGNREYLKANFEQSELDYRRALDQKPNSEKATFNLGDALYRSGKFKEAGTEFEKVSSTSTEKKPSAESNFNLGNSLLKAGALEESIEAFKQSLIIDPANHQAKYNLAYAQDQLKQKEQQEDENKEEGDNQDNKNEEEGSDKQDENNKDGDDNKQQKNSEDQNPDEKSNDQKQDQSDENRMTKEDAERLLQALANNEQEVQERVKEEKAAAARVKTIKNW